jgi:hypothetical protein
MPARELVGALQQRGHAMRAVHTADELGCGVRVHPRRGDEQRPAAVTAEHGDRAPSRERGLR